MDANTRYYVRTAEQSFNPRARDGREDDLSPPIAKSARFNPRARDGREYSNNELVAMIKFQSTRP